jgi:hypothetical protein
MDIFFKLEVTELNEIFLRIKRFVCKSHEDCTEPVLYGEETAISVQFNVVLDNSVFKYPEDYHLVIN